MSNVAPEEVGTFVLISGAGGSAWYWHRLVEELHRRGHDAVAVGLPAGDDSAGLSEYADTVVAAIGDRTGLVMVAQSMAGFTAPNGVRAGGGGSAGAVERHGPSTR